MPLRRTARPAAIALAVCAAVAGPGVAAHAETAPQVGIGQNRARLLADLQAYRTAHGLPLLAENRAMDADAQTRAETAVGGLAPVDGGGDGSESTPPAAAAPARTDRAGLSSSGAAYGQDLATSTGWAAFADAGVTDVGLGYAYDATGRATEVVELAALPADTSAQQQPTQQAVAVADDGWTVGAPGGVLGAGLGYTLGADGAILRPADAAAIAAAQDGASTPATTPPRPVVAVRRSGSRVVVRWKPVAIASRYRVVARWHGRDHGRTLTARRVVLRVPRGAAVRVEVTAVTADGRGTTRSRLPAATPAS